MTRIEYLQKVLQRDLGTCSNSFERSMVQAIGGKEIRELAIQLSKERQLSNHEIFIASAYGYR